MDVPEHHRYAAASLVGMSLLGESALLLQASTITVFYLTLAGGITGLYIYAYLQGDPESR